HPLRLETALGVLDPAPEAASIPWQVGQRVTALVRPNAARRLEPGQAAANRIQGVVEDLLFRGEGYRLVLRAQDGVRLSFNVDEPLPLGANVTFSLDAAGILILEAEA
ncbi:TOBE domain-containing protein, partial [Thermanaerothrix sp.]|uniref:TOBE domain-containing protein n=1 Tax=Thermanaerothrix sp. TaxID=2972675 RepID=UPI002ADDB2CF